MQTINKNRLKKRDKLKPVILKSLESKGNVVDEILDLVYPIIPETEQQRMVSILCETMEIDSRLNGNRVARLAADIFKAEGTPDVVLAKYQRGGWYWENDWKGKRGDPITEYDIRRTWGKWDREPSARDMLKTYNPDTGQME